MPAALSAAANCSIGLSGLGADAAGAPVLDVLWACAALAADLVVAAEPGVGHAPVMMPLPPRPPPRRGPGAAAAAALPAACCAVAAVLAAASAAVRSACRVCQEVYSS